MPNKPAVILSRNRDPGPWQIAMEQALLAGLESRDRLQVLVVPHLYDLAPEGPTVQTLRAIEGDLIVLAWLYPRSVYWVLEANQICGKLGQTPSLGVEEAVNEWLEHESESGLPNRTIWCFDLRSNSQPEYFLRQIDETVSKASASAVAVPTDKPDGKVRVLEEPTRPRWYPVVDRARCLGCNECLNFCLFGVWGFDHAGKIFVEDPDACRPGCPACARICPAGAIMFPQHNDPAIAGDPQKSLGGPKPELYQISPALDRASVAARERERALADAPPSSEKGDSAQAPRETNQATLDQLVDRIDGLDL